jgi:hypothetical protein
MANEDDTDAAKAGPYVLPRYLRFARTLALVSGATVGVASGISVISTSGCSSSCNGICGVMGVRPNNGGESGFMGTTGIGGFLGTTGTGGAGGLLGIRPPDSDASDVGPDTGVSDDGAANPIVDGGSDDAGDAGGGPRPAPLLPRAWIG